MCSYIADLKEDRDTKIPDSLVLAYYDMAKRIATKGNFCGYTYIEDAVNDSVIWAIKYLKNFNPDVTTNVYGYMTQLIHNCFKQRLNKEKMQASIRHDEEQNLVDRYDVQVLIKDGKKRYRSIDENSPDKQEEYVQEKKIEYVLTWEESFKIFVL